MKLFQMKYWILIIATLSILDLYKMQTNEVNPQQEIVDESLGEFSLLKHFLSSQKNMIFKNSKHIIFRVH
jgi:hypothetical protein